MSTGLVLSLGILGYLAMGALCAYLWARFCDDGLGDVAGMAALISVAWPFLILMPIAFALEKAAELGAAHRRKRE